MEAERILTDAMLCSVRIAMPHDYAETMEANRFDVVVVDAGVVENGGSDTIRRQRQLGAAVIFTTLTNDSMERVPEFRGLASVAKPFIDEELLAAVAVALKLPELDI
jgi:DNA-binding response OmpR family regulator